MHLKVQHHSFAAVLSTLPHFSIIVKIRIIKNRQAAASVCAFEAPPRALMSMPIYNSLHLKVVSLHGTAKGIWLELSNVE